MNKLFLIILFITIFITNCAKELSEVDLLNKSNPIGSYGIRIPNVEQTEMISLFNNPNKYLGQDVLISGKITEVCPMRGCWINISDFKRQFQIRIKVVDGKIVFPLSAKGKCVNAHGIFTKLTFSEEQAINWKIHLAEEKGITLLYEDVEITPDDLVEYRINADGASIYNQECD